ncbi:MAG: hypothetical protein ACTS8H_01930, partial [Arsenophonus sp. NC-PE1-MAG3]
MYKANVIHINCNDNFGFKLYTVYLGFSLASVASGILDIMSQSVIFYIGLRYMRGQTGDRFC